MTQGRDERTMMSKPVSDYAMIGDGETAALIAKNGSIDWLCWPRFDSGACFAALLGQQEHGCWQLAPAGDWTRLSRSYRDNTLILETTFETPTGIVTLIDFMPVRHDRRRSELVRVVACARGHVDMHMDMNLRFDYGRVRPWMSQVTEATETDALVRAVAGPHSVFLDAPVRKCVTDASIEANFRITAGERLPFILAYGESHLPPPEICDAEMALQETEAYWLKWSAKSTYDGPWKQDVIRSLITVKALTYTPTGGIVAAPTTSLPEQPGGPRNWDYRYCWLRDTSFILGSLLGAGYKSEATAWCDWLLRAVAGCASQIQPVYGIGGEQRIDEVELDWLPGHDGSRPVRTGNGAYKQLQIDIYGFVIDTLHSARVAGLDLDEAADDLQLKLLNQLCEAWRLPDEGIWEVRSEPKHFVHSKLMAWVAFDRAVKSAEKFGLAGPVTQWRAHRDEIRAEILDKGFNSERGVFVQSYGSSALDASLLLMPILGFLPPDDPRMIATTRAIEQDLSRDGLLLRYDSSDGNDGLPPSNGAFLACSFWLADNMILQGRVDEAKTLYQHLLSLRNDVGLLAEQFNLKEKAMTGNFPQAFSHFALIDTAFAFLDEAKDR